MRATVAAALLALSLSPFASAQSVTDPNLVITPYLTGLTRVTGIRFTGPNTGFAIQKGGVVKYFTGGATSTVLTLAVNQESERGLLGIAIDPAFASNGHVYLYYSAADGGGAWTDNRLVRYTWNGSTLGSAQFLRTFGTSADGLTNGPNHDGGPLAFGPDGKLYGATGDLNRVRVEQNDRSTSQTAYAGGIYRLNSDGTTPADNPFTGAFAPWYAYGVRNSFGMAFDPVTGRLWDTENGAGSYDEINLVDRGFNSGWRQIMGPDSRNAANAPGSLNMLAGATYSDPEFSWFRPIGVTSLQFLHGSSWGTGYDNGLLVGEANSGRLWLFRLNGTRDGLTLAGSLADGVLDDGDALAAFGAGFGVTTDIQVGPDGALYVASHFQNRVYRIAPVPEPSHFALMAAGLALIGWRLRGRRAK